MGGDLPALSVSMVDIKPKYVEVAATSLSWEGLNLDPSIIAKNSKRITERIETPHNIIREPVAIVGFGPSLKDTWPPLRWEGQERA